MRSAGKSSGLNLFTGRACAARPALEGRQSIARGVSPWHGAAGGARVERQRTGPASPQGLTPLAIDCRPSRAGFRLLVRIVASALAVLALAAPASAQSEPKRIVAPEARIEQRLNAQVPLDLTFRDEQGSERPLRDFVVPGKPVVLVLAYYRCPKLCSMVLNGVMEGLRPVEYEMGKDYAVVTVSIDPRET